MRLRRAAPTGIKKALDFNHQVRFSLFQSIVAILGRG